MWMLNRISTLELTQISTQNKEKDISSDQIDQLAEGMSTVSLTSVPIMPTCNGVSQLRKTLEGALSQPESFHQLPQDWVVVSLDVTENGKAIVITRTTVLHPTSLF